jgi:hypothetical protein
MRRVLPLALLAVLIVSSLPAQTFSAEDLRLFETQVQPVLTQNCLVCHSNELQSSGLGFTSRAALLAGGNRGPAAVPGDPAASLLMQAVRQSGDLKMPPAGKLPD